MTQPQPHPGDEIHEMAASDLPEATTLYVRVFNAPPWNDAWTEATAAARLGQALNTPGSLGLVTRIDGRLVGVAVGYEEQWYSGTHFSLKEMFVDPGAQGTGVGTGLMTHLKQVLRTRGLARMYLLTARDGPASDFYRKNGFRQSDHTVLMTCPLEGPAG